MMNCVTACVGFLTGFSAFFLIIANSIFCVEMFKRQIHVGD